MGKICCIIGCSNSTYNLERWKATFCHEHGTKYGDKACNCEAPFTLHPFPTFKQNNAMRMIWTRRVNRKDPKSGKNWLPDKNSRICSNHFVDGRPTKENASPTLVLGYTNELQTPGPSRPSPKKRESLPPRSNKKKGSASSNDLELPKKTSIAHDHGDYIFSCTCGTDCQCIGCHEMNKTLVDREHEIDCLTSQLNELKLKHSCVDFKFNINKFLGSDKKVKHYTGLPNRLSFYNLLSHVQKVAKGMRYWIGTKKVTSTKVPRKFKHTPKKSGPGRKLNICSEFLLVLMKLRLGLTNEFLSDIFCIAKSTCSQIFNTWIKMLAKELQPLIFWPDKGMTKKQMPSSLHSEYPNLRCTIDCTEFFIGRPRHLHLQALTWSDYKRHNTLKVLVGIAPNGMITFLSQAWGGRASDNHITKKSGFLDLIEPGDLIMADRGFTIREDLMLRNSTLFIPPPSAGLEQQTKQDVMKTKKIANARIHVERAIGRLKWFSLLKNTLPINLIPIIDDMLTVCAALCNLLPPLVY